MAEEMDQGLKRLCQMRPRDLLAFALPDAEFLAPLPTDLAAEPRLITDTLFRVRYKGRECLVDLEIEAVTSTALPERLYRYGSRAYDVYRLPVLSTVLWLQRGHGGRPPSSPFVMAVGDEVISTWNFRGIALYEMTAVRLLGSGLLGLLPLVPFTRGGGTERAVERAARAIQEWAPADQRVPMETLLAVFGARTLGVEAVLAVLRRLSMSTELLDTSPLYRMWVDKAHADGARDVMLAQWRARYGEPEADVRAELERRHDAEDLLRLAVALADTHERGAARGLLGLPPEVPAAE